MVESMDATILCILLAQRINPEHFQLRGQAIEFLAPEYNTQENQAIVADVIANYDMLAAEYQAKQSVIQRRNAYKAEADPIYAEWQALLSVEHADAESRRLEWLAKRAEIAAGTNK